ncbi:hypothetical protein [Nocardia jinanensis]|uniref:Uncharacterized protein n=1 Tax=Nocardia jinanensis TaxID=382504 RepID=A0A917VVJ0_9NOCA|nr:hypothetical protein [Nocardia jinanensis]GGL24469.1 hypothetical protein GCM10011588_44070 [Nocardia jinanensis]
MIDGFRRAIGEVVERLGAVIAGTGVEVVRRYRGTGTGIQTGVSVTKSAEAGGRADIDRENREVRAEAAGTGGASSRLMSVDELTTRILAAERSGEPELRTPDHMFSMNSETDLFVYPDGFEVVRKVGLAPAQRSAEILAAAVGRAIGAPVAPVVAGTHDSVLMQRLPGRIEPGTTDDPGAREAMKALADTPGARKLGLLDVLVRNWDRPGNWLRDGDRVYGFDHAEAFRADRDFESESNPFTSHYGAPGAPDTGRWNEWKPNDLSRAELDRYEAEIVALRPLFEEHARLDWATGGQPLAWHDGVLSRLGTVREHATRP